MTRPPAEVVRADFDRIAPLIADPDAVGPEGERLLARLPADCGAVLDVGCGTGALCRRLAGRAGRVVGIDLSPEMVRIARVRSAGIDNLELAVADVMTWEPPAGGFDAVVSMAALHHLPLAAGLARLAAAVRPGGLLLVVDLFDTRGLRELPYNALSAAARRLAGRVRRHDPAATAAWRAHDAHDHHQRLGVIRRTAAARLPGARVRRHLGWRYSLEWRRVAQPGS
jgi:SAM-dependent methyltransferase